MTLFDGIVLGIVLLSVLFGSFRGLTRECLSLLSWFGAAFGSLTLIPTVHPFVSHFVTNPWISLIIAGGALFLLFLIVFLLLSDGLVSYVRSTCLSSVDRMLGALFGLARGGLFVCFAFWLGVFFIPQTQINPFIQDALFRPHLESAAAFLKNELADLAITENALHFLQEKFGPFMEKSLLSQEKPPAPTEPTPENNLASSSNPPASLSQVLSS